MVGEMAADSWFSSLWRNSWKGDPEPEKATVGILSFELVGLMSKLVSLWNSLSDKEVARMRSDIINLVGVRKLVSENDDFLMNLVLGEIIENLGYVAKSVIRLGKRCTDPWFHRLHELFSDPVEMGEAWYKLEYQWRKMEKKVKKMERFIAATLQLHQEIDVLSELEQTLRRMQGYADVDRVKLLEFQQKVFWQRQEVKHLRDMSPWNRSYDYTVRILLKSLFTILERVKLVFGISNCASVEHVSEDINSDNFTRSHSLSALMSSVHPSENSLCGFYSGPIIGKSLSNLIARENESTKGRYFKTKRLRHFGPFKGCMLRSSASPVLQRCKETGGSMRSTSLLQSSIYGKTENGSKGSSSSSYRIIAKLLLVNFKGRISNAAPNTLGDAALSLHYANIIILIEKFASSPHLIGPDARNDLYNMLPTTLKFALRGRLKLYAKTLASAVYDPDLAAEWSLAMSRILEWLTPLARNMIRWQSERNFEKQHMTSGCNVLLVQTLYYANQEKAEAAVAELLMGLNYICRFGKDPNEKKWLSSAAKNASDGFLPRRNMISCNV